MDRARLGSGDHRLGRAHEGARGRELAQRDPLVVGLEQGEAVHARPDHHRLSRGVHADVRAIAVDQPGVDLDLIPHRRAGRAQLAGQHLGRGSGEAVARGQDAHPGHDEAVLQGRHRGVEVGGDGRRPGLVLVDLEGGAQRRAGRSIAPALDLAVAVDDLRPDHDEAPLPVAGHRRVVLILHQVLVSQEIRAHGGARAGEHPAAHPVGIDGARSFPDGQEGAGRRAGHGRYLLDAGRARADVERRSLRRGAGPRRGGEAQREHTSPEENCFLH